MNLQRALQQRDAHVIIVGLGYVGVPLAIEVADAGFTVSGLDIDKEKTDLLAKGETDLVDVDPSRLSRLVTEGRFTPTTDPSCLAKADVVVVCVPTPLRSESPDMSYIEAAASKITEFLHDGQLIILESTTYPGTTEELLLTKLESSGLKAGIDFHLGFSPERIDPGNDSFGLRNVPKIVGGINDESSDLMEAFYSCFVGSVVKVSSPRTAEMAKLLENTYRHVNIALVNEIAMLCHDLGIDVWEVIDAASTKPFGFQPFYPGPGWGGHCIPVDPAYLSWRVRQVGATARFVELAREFNQKMPEYVVQRVAEALNMGGKSLKGSRVMVLGVAYKPGVGDVRESPAIEMIERLHKAGADVAFNDPYVPTLGLKSGDLHSTGLDEIGAFDIVVVHTDHQNYDWNHVGASARLVLDTRNALKGTKGNVIRL
ncbi:MAG: nucleotide sugar dehydrogenase [Actinomycetota bacterium]|nr:nucleotide sugar dehydrogenase [Actinomycetota bacterium]